MEKKEFLTNEEKQSIKEGRQIIDCLHEKMEINYKRKRGKPDEAGFIANMHVKSNV